MNYKLVLVRIHMQVPQPPSIEIPLNQGYQPHMAATQQYAVMQMWPQTNATLALILACVSIVAGGFCLAIPAIIIANGALQITNQFPGHPDAGNAKAAHLIGWIITGLYAVVFAFYLIMIIFVVSTGNI